MTIFFFFAQLKTLKKHAGALVKKKKCSLSKHCVSDVFIKYMIKIIQPMHQHSLI